MSIKINFCKLNLVPPAINKFFKSFNSSPYVCKISLPTKSSTSLLSLILPLACNDLIIAHLLWTDNSSRRLSDSKLIKTFIAFFFFFPVNCLNINAAFIVFLGVNFLSSAMRLLFITSNESLSLPLLVRRCNEVNTRFKSSFLQWRKIHNNAFSIPTEFLSFAI